MDNNIYFNYQNGNINYNNQGLQEIENLKETIKDLEDKINDLNQLAFRFRDKLLAANDFQDLLKNQLI